jgi:hypothetical protein
VPELGFFDVPAQPTAATYPARLFYDFQPADVDPAHKPLVVLFNGGPGFATTAELLSYGTGRHTIDPAADAGAVANDNPASWTRFANLLYIDDRVSGFSYGLGRPPVCVPSEIEDASDFVRGVLDFLDGHDALRAGPVVLAGESYGGTRASYMLDLLLRYSTEASRGGADLTAQIQSHYDAIYPDRAGTVIDEVTAARQFGAQILIQPYLLGQKQGELQFPLMKKDPHLSGYVETIDGDLTISAAVDNYDAREPLGWSQGLWARAELTLADPAQATALLGDPLTAVPLLMPEARATGFRTLFAQGDPVDTAQATLDATLTSELGPLAAGDGYFGVQGATCDVAPATTPFLDNLRWVRTFITNARYDLVIYAPAIPAAMTALGVPTQFVTAARPGVSRPGWLEASLPPSGDAKAASVEIRFPTYDQAGHAVATRQGADLAADVQAWLQGP